MTGGPPEGAAVGPTGAVSGEKSSPSVLPRQPIVKQPGRSRRAKLLPAPGTDPNPDPPVREEGGVADVGTSRGENDDRLRQDRPPHW